MMEFIRNLVGIKTDEAMRDAVETLVRWDPKSATEAELLTMEQHLDRLGRQVAEARAQFDRETREAEAVRKLSAQRMAAAERLQGELAAEADPAKKAGLDKSLETLVGLLEQMAPEVEREAKDADDARDFLAMLEKAYADAGAKLKEAKSRLDRAQRDMSRAGQQREMAERQAEAARQTAGLAGATSSLDTALKAMQDAAAKDLATAEAARRKSELLTPSKPEEDDPHIARALAEVTGTAAASHNLSERLDRLRGRQV